MGIECKGVCRHNKQYKKPKYEKFSWCIVCSACMPIELIRCPCCHAKLRHKRHHKLHAAQTEYREKIKQQRRSFSNYIQHMDNSI